MIILPVQRLLLVSTGVAVGWMSIDNGSFTWHTDPQAVTDLADLEGDEFLFIAQAGTVLNSTASLKRGNISAGLTLASVPIPVSSIHWTKRLGRATHALVVTPYRIASSRGDRKNVYCLGSIKRTDTARMFIIRSQDAADSNLATETLADILEFDEVGPKSPFTIAVHPVDADIVATGFGGAALSTDGGIRWNSLTSLRGWHADVHELLFHLEPAPKGKRTAARKPRRYSLYIPSDGGILRWTGLDADLSYTSTLITADSRRNRSLPIVMLYSPDGKHDAAFGNMSVAAGLIASGSQDNANLWTDATNPVWRRHRGGDGGATVLVSSGIVPALILGSDSLNRISVREAQQVSSSTFGPPNAVPIRPNATTLDATGIVPVFLKPVMAAIGLNVGQNSRPAIALASPRKSNVVYAAAVVPVTDQSGALISQQIEWNIFGNIAGDEVVAPLEPYDNRIILVGTESGRMFSLKEQATPSEISFKQRPSGAIRGIASTGSTITCFETLDKIGYSGNPTSRLYLNKSAPHTRPTKFSKGQTSLVDVSFFPRNDGLSLFHSIAANRSSRNTYLSFAVTVSENEVWVCKSSDPFSWQRVVRGLPHAIRCSDLVFSESGKGGELLLSSYGRGVWRLWF